MIFLKPCKYHNSNKTSFLHVTSHMNSSNIVTLIVHLYRNIMQTYLTANKSTHLNKNLFFDLLTEIYYRRCQIFYVASSA